MDWLIFVLMFNHIRELHHSQTQNSETSKDSPFNHIRELHHSQTCKCYIEGFKSFNHIRELHHSQTSIRQ